MVYKALHDPVCQLSQSHLCIFISYCSPPWYSLKIIKFVPNLRSLLVISVLFLVVLHSVTTQPIPLHTLESHSHLQWFPLPHVQFIVKHCVFYSPHKQCSKLFLIPTANSWVHYYLSFLISLATANQFSPLWPKPTLLNANLIQSQPAYMVFNDFPQLGDRDHNS